MMKTMFSVALCAVAVVATLSSCSTTKKVPSQEEIEAKIVGKWKNTIVDGKDVLTNERTVSTHASDGTSTHSTSRHSFSLGDGIHRWDNKVPSKWSVEGDILSEKSGATGITHLSKVIKIDDNHCSYITIKDINPEGLERTHNTALVIQKVTVDYSHDIIGLWEGVAITGDETYGDAEARIEYKADGTYTYYKKENGNNWMPSKNVDNEYNVDGDWLATRWRPSAGAEFNYEWWDIDYIKGDEMKWSALREKEDGTRFTTTFTWKKVR